jgi:uncharacterized protein
VSHWLPHRRGANSRSVRTLRAMDIAAEKYVSFTTFKRDGTPVSTPVWIARLPDGRVGFTTDPNVGKVKRLRNNPAVTLRPCSLKGTVAADAPTVSGKGEVATGADHEAVWRAVRRKYWLIANAMHVADRAKTFVRRSHNGGTAIVITLD